MIRLLSRLFSVWMTLAGLALMMACSEPASKTPPPTSAESQANEQQLREIRQRLQGLRLRLRTIDGRIEDQLRATADLTSETQSMMTEINQLDHQLTGRPLPVASSPAAKTAPAPASKGPLTPLMRLLLIVIALVAIWIMARIYLGRAGEEDEDDEDSIAEGGDEELTTEEGTTRINPEVQPPAAETPEPPRSPAADENAEPKP